MMKYLRISLVVAVFSICCIGLTGETGVSVFRRSAMEPYQDAESGLAFPAAVGTFQKVIVSKNNDPRIGTVVRYENEMGSYADVYIYTIQKDGSPVPESALKSHFEQVCSNIMNSAAGFKQITSVQRLPDRGNDPKFPGVSIGARFQLKLGTDSFVSRVRLFLRNGRIVKVRCSFDGAMAEEEDNAAAFEWVISSLAVSNSEVRKK